MNRKLVFVFLMAAATVGCSAGSSKSPVAQLKSLIRPGSVPATWEMNIFFLGPSTCTVAADGISYDVKQTDSLVSPLIGEIRIFVRKKYGKDRSGNSDETVVRRYNFLDGQWVPEDEKYFLDDKSSNPTGKPFKIVPALARKNYDEYVKRFLFK